MTETREIRKPTEDELRGFVTTALYMMTVLPDAQANLIETLIHDLDHWVKDRKRDNFRKFKVKLVK